MEAPTGGPRLLGKRRWAGGSAAAICCLLLLLQLTLPCSACLNIFRGLYRAYWITVPLPTRTVQNMLADGVELEEVARPGLAAGMHPLVLELGREFSAGPIGFHPLQSDFFEAKVEVPWVRVTDRPNSPPSTSKLVIFMDRPLNTLTSRLLYGLDARSPPQMNMSATSYVIGTSAGMFVANITRGGACGSTADFPEFQWYVEVMSQRWFGRRPRVCAQHSYQFASAQLCPINVTLASDPNVLDPNFPSGPLPVPSIRAPLGAVQVLIEFSMTAPCFCL